jgi:hypothetical protein
MDCASFWELGDDDQNYTYSYPSTRPDNYTDEDWSCWVYSYDQYYDYLTEAVTESCYHSVSWDYWCGYNITAINGDQIDNLDCSVFYDYTRFYDDYYRAMNDTNSTNSTDWQDYYDNSWDGTYKPDNWTDPFWKCYSYSCEVLNEYELSYCFLDNCTHNVTEEEYCMVQFSTWDGNYTYENMDCASFRELGDDVQNYTYTYPSTRPDDSEPDWSCSVWYYDMYYDWLTEAAYESCYT